MSNPYLQSPIHTSRKQPSTISGNEARVEITELREAVEHHNHLYYVANQPAISDGEFDELFRRIEELEVQFPELRDPNSPTQRVGTPPQDGLHRVAHHAPMLSLSSSVEKEGIQRFISFLKQELDQTAPAVVLEPKLDGFSVEIVYREGRFERGATRGDGQEGEDISANLKTIASVPLHLRTDTAVPPLLVVRGEVFMTKSGFHRLNERRIEEGQEPFANARNAAAGSVRLLDSRETAKVPLDIYFYEVLTAENLAEGSHFARLDRFPSWGLKTNPLNTEAKNFEEINAFYQKILDRRETLDYEIDGVVIKVDSLSGREKLGTRNRSPRWAMAWKFPPRQETTLLQAIDVQVGRTGILTPVAKLDPVTIGGTTVRRASLHNAEEVRKKDLRVGDTVRVQRAGDVIPEVTEVVDPHRANRPDPFSMPRACPACGTNVEQDGAYHLCPAGLSCPPQLRGSLEHFVSREAMDIEHLGEKNCALLIEYGLVNSVADLYLLTTEQLQDLPGFGEKAAGNLTDAIKGSTRPELRRFIYALGIRHVGLHVARLLSEAYPDFGRLRNAAPEDLREIDEIGRETATSIAAFFARDENNRIVNELLERGVEPLPPNRQAGRTTLSGSTFVITGSLEGFTRKEATERIESLGGRVTSSVSGSTDYLVCGRDPGSKLEQAREEGTTILEESDFHEMVGE